MKLGFERRGSRKDFAKDPAVVTEVSWPSFACLVSFQTEREGIGDDELIFGVMNIHCGSIFASRSL